jgi:hypothetical protein
MKAYAVEITEPNNPKLGQGEDAALCFPPPTNVMHMLRYNDPMKKNGWIKAFKKYLETVIDSGILSTKELTKPNDAVVLTTEDNDQDGNVDKLKV